MVDQKVFKVTDFEWEICFKYTMEGLVKAVKPIGPASQLERPRDIWEPKIDLREV